MHFYRCLSLVLLQAFLSCRPVESFFRANDNDEHETGDDDDDAMDMANGTSASDNDNNDIIDDAVALAKLVYAPNASTAIANQFIVAFDRRRVTDAWAMVQQIMMKSNDTSSSSSTSSSSIMDVRTMNNGSRMLKMVQITLLNATTVTQVNSTLLPWLKSSMVEWIEQDQIMTASDVQKSAPWGLDRLDQLTLPLDNTYRYDVSGKGVTAYVIDTGIRFTHQEFEGRATCPVSFIEGEGCEDGVGHGTHVAGIIGSRTYGVAKSVNLVGVKVLSNDGSGSTSGVLEGIEWVIDTAMNDKNSRKVSNLSLGGFFSKAINNAVAMLVDDAGVFTAVAAGNANINACFVSPASASWSSGVVTVGATDVNDVRSVFSNFGKCVDIFAPGTDIESTWFESDRDTNTISGTSMASPHVAGVAALFLEADPNLSPAGVAESMFASSSMNVVSNANTEPNRLAHTGQLTLSAQGVPGGSNQDSSSTRQVFEFLSTAIALLVAFLIV